MASDLLKQVKSISFIFFFSLIMFLCFGKAQLKEQTYAYHYCTGRETENQKSKSVNLLLSQLSSKASKYRFHNATIKATDGTIYGLFQCRGDVTLKTCRNCVDTAAQFLNQNCSNGKEGIVWFEHCMLRYSTNFIFSTGDESKPSFLCSTRNAYNEATFVRKLSELYDNLVAKVVRGSPFPSFAVGQMKMAEFTSLGCLLQCTPNISPLECSKCLYFVKANYKKDCQGRSWGMIFEPSCQF